MDAFTLRTGALEVEFRLDPTYTRNSADNVHAYDRELAFAGGERYTWQAVGVRVLQDGRVLHSAVLLLPLGCAEPGPGTIVLRPDALYLPAGGEVVALDVPGLKVRWETRSTMGCVFGIRAIPGEDALIAHGEMCIARVEPDGRIAWERAGRDIFTGELRIAGDAVEVTDFDGEPYRFRLSNGEILDAPPPRRVPEPPSALGWADRLRAWLGLAGR